MPMAGMVSASVMSAPSAQGNVHEDEHEAPAAWMAVILPEVSALAPSDARIVNSMATHVIMQATRPERRIAGPAQG